ncbi:RF-PROK-I domain-containing protein [Mycena indigotica]|uniref:RF-PROK-I domain-containing protein n=1 Tax=Mycena indigotica TaxID=2126181 RepID=A0A8H6WES5_9AGAR|nr:RF-PROK-I domain-containing protein [Mycena indigotica]KAF7312153.1 RF-PROK-I domain-containing protein [Mycena indigotica]
MFNLLKLGQRVVHTRGLRQAHHRNKSFLIPPHIPSLGSSEETAAARVWISQFRASKIPKSAVTLSFSRSSGPGGQNVNKVNTKAMIRCSIDAEWIPPWAKSFLERSPYYVVSSQSLQLTSSVFRSQSQNIDDCLSKLHALVLEASSADVKVETSAEQKNRVASLMKGADIKRRNDKTYRSQIKATRKSPKRE